MNTARVFGEVQMSDKDKTKEQLIEELVKMRQRIAELEAAEAKRKQAEEMLRAQYQATPIPTYTWQRAGQDFILVDYNDAAAAITNGRVSNFIGKKASEMYQDSPDILDDLSRCFAEKTSIKREMRYQFISTGESKYLVVSYAFVPPEFVLVHTEDITERKQVEEEVRERTYALNQRVKELNCLYFIGHCIDQQGVSLEEILHEVVELIPPAFQYPEIACARITIGYQVFTTDNFEETIWKLASNIVVDGNRTGILEVCYLEEKPECDEGPFLKEEKGLLNAIAARLGETIERRGAQEALQASEEKYRALVNQMAEGYIVLQGDRIVFANKAAAEGVGMPVKELIGRTFWEFVVPESIPRAKRIYERTMIGGRTPRTEELVIQRKDGSKTPCEVSLRRIAYEGKPSYGIVIRDITERKRTEEQLIRLSNAVRISVDSLVITDLEANILEVNEATLRMYGTKDKNDLVGKNALHLIAPEDHKQALAGMREVLKSGYHENREYRIITKDGSRITVEMNTATIKDADGKPVGFVAVSRDITERKRAEGQLIRLSNAVRISVDSIVITDLEANILEVNEATLRMYGTKDENDLIGKNAFYFIAREDRKKALADGEKTLKRGYTKNREYQIVTKDGTRIPVEMSTAIMKDADGKPVGFVAVARDITERKRAEEEIKRHAKRVEALHAVARTVAQTLDLQELLDNALAEVLEVMDVEAGGIFLLDIAKGDLSLRAHKGLSENFVHAVGSTMLEEDELERAQQRHDTAMKLEEILNEASLSALHGAVEREGLKMFTMMPLWIRGVMHGVLGIASHTPTRVAPEDMELLQAMANQIAIGIENAMLFTEVSNAAIIDGLTGLHNHRYFQERLEEEWARCLRFGGECSLIMLDLDHFKIYNDLFGHVAGDEVLKKVGQVLRDYTRQVDICCRYGGEEFAVILPHTDSIGAYETAERLRQAIEAALALESGDGSINLTVSLGVASWPNDGLSREELIRRADIALSQAKERGRNQTCLASEAMSSTRAKKDGLQEVAEHLEAASLNTIYALAAAVDARDRYTYGHSRNVSKYAVAMGKALGLPKKRLGQLRIAALLHDIGKIGLSDSIIRKPGPLDEEEREMMKKHCQLGANIISHTPELANCSLAIQHHHEWYDGNGYPHGLKGEDIPLEARIIAIADAYDTMTTPRSYRQTVSPREAIEELRRCANTQFDPILVEVLAQVTNTSITSTT